jgi:heme/copper-type cytochrome/quinol oxidase subunit 2
LQAARALKFMIIQYLFEIFYLTLIGIIMAFMLVFFIVTRKPKGKREERQNGEQGESAVRAGMEKSEKSWLYFLLAVVLIGNLITLSPLIPSTNYAMWSQSTPVETITIQVENYSFIMPQNPIIIPLGKVVQFIVQSSDVTYGFGVFRKDGTMVFQMQVVPEPYTNTLRWVFDQPGFYDVRSTEYSGPQNPLMFVPNAIQVEG